ncbi:hypothetical protein GCE9029_01017 [Grimontia celer]|uniref:Uncharacterized protein n=1 Tax=Grimontia celer TaxID=1796497 RepID=A0A128EX27_9GAMM|nr:hypothetical protein GCE9029_01017 [Grimontia celer]
MCGARVYVPQTPNPIIPWYWGAKPARYSREGVRDILAACDEYCEGLIFFTECLAD